jgi:hypothetical protein
MERRGSRRLKVDLKAERISGRGKHTVFIENISEHGILMVVPHSDETKKFGRGTDVELNFRLGPGNAIVLSCRVRWSIPGMPPDGLTDSIGLEVIEPPEAYRKFVKALH